MEKELVLCDTNVFIHWFNNDSATIEKINQIGLENIALSVITAMELIEGVDNKKQLQQLKKKLRNYYILDVTKEISVLSHQLIEDFKLSHFLQIPDAIIGATAIINNLPLFTYNTKDFHFMPGIKLL